MLLGMMFGVCLMSGYRSMMSGCVSVNTLSELPLAVLVPVYGEVGGG